MKINNADLQDLIDKSEHHSYSTLDGKKRCKIGLTIYQQLNDKQWELVSSNGIKHDCNAINLGKGGHSRMKRRR